MNLVGEGAGAAAAPELQGERSPESCPLCDAPSAPAFSALDRNRGIPGGPFHYRRCERCRTLFLTPVPEDLSRFYPADYLEAPGRDELERLVPAERHKVEIVCEHVSGGRLVEVGPGGGAFALAAQRAGFEVAVIERDARGAARLRSALGVEAVVSEDPAAAIGELAPARAVALWHALEHLQDPGGMVAAAAAALDPGGVLVVATPNPSAFQFRLLRTRWTHVDAPRHLVLIPASALIARAGRAGLDLAALTTDDEEGRFWNLFGWKRSLAPAGSGPARRAVATAAGALLGRLPTEYGGLRGAAYTAVFRNRGEP